MSANLDSGFYKITALTENPRFVSLPNGIFPATEFIRLAEPDQIWKIEKIGERYRFSIAGFPYTGMIDGKAAASKILEDSVVWHVTYRDHGAFTIELPWDYSKGWTVSDPQSPNSEIVIAEINEGFLNQLFSILEVKD